MWPNSTISLRPRAETERGKSGGDHTPPLFTRERMDRIKLPPRLAAIGRLVPDGARLADVGTDHGLLPIALLRAGKIRSAVATDIRPGPLARARENAARYGAEGLRLVLCDGLALVSPEEVDTVVIAGMGGETAVEILAAAPWTADTFLILQPMSRPEALRAALPGLGLAITGETLAEDTGRLYPVLTARRGESPPLSETDLYTGRWELIRTDPLAGRLFKQLQSRLKTAAAGLGQSEREEDRGRLEHIRRVLRELELRGRLYDAGCYRGCGVFGAESTPGAEDGF